MAKYTHSVPAALLVHRAMSLFQRSGTEIDFLAASPSRLTDTLSHIASELARYGLQSGPGVDYSLRSIELTIPHASAARLKLAVIDIEVYGAALNDVLDRLIPLFALPVVSQAGASLHS